MKRFWFGVLWLAAFALAGAALVHRVLPAGIPVGGITLPGAAVGVSIGVLLFFFLAGLNWLPGARLRPGGLVRWGWPQAVWMVVQFFFMQIAAQILFMLVVFAARLVAALQAHQPVASVFDVGPALGDALVFATAAGYLAAGWWSVWYISRLGTARLTDGAPSGIGWRAAPRQGYLAAFACLLVVGAAGSIIEHVLPPSPDAAHGGLVEQIFGTHGWKVVALFLLAAVVAPFLEELVFRGGMIAALAPKFGVFWAAAVTSIVFTACHAQETWSYHPGLLVILVIAVLLAWLRLRYQSIRPGILLHVLFNGCSVLALAFTH
jgi:membrane protease YdiL (CAAX protease family)